MPSNPPNAEMGRIHEDYIARVLDGRRTRASGSQWFDQGDVRNNHDLPFAFCADGKSTKGKQIAVTLAMIEKLREQAQGERPVMPLRWYGNDNLDEVLEDWFLVTGPDMEEMLTAARAWAEISSCVGGMTPDNIREYLEEWGKAREAARVLADGTQRMIKGHEQDLGTISALQDALDQARRDLLDAGERVAARDLELQALRERGPLAVPATALSHVPQLPWTVLKPFSEDEQAQRKAARQPDAGGIAFDYAADGTVQSRLFKEARIERSMNNRPKVFVDNVQARIADLYDTRGVLRARVWQDKPSAEVG